MNILKTVKVNLEHSKLKKAFLLEVEKIVSDKGSIHSLWTMLNLCMIFMWISHNLILSLFLCLKITFRAFINNFAVNNLI